MRCDFERPKEVPAIFDDRACSLSPCYLSCLGSDGDRATDSSVVNVRGSPDPYLDDIQTHERLEKQNVA